MQHKSQIRKFTTGATRDSVEGKYDFEGFLSPIVIYRYGKYMHKHRKQSNGSLRDSDNWQKGIDKITYIKSLWRHFLDLWALHRKYYVYKERTNKGEKTIISKKEIKNKKLIIITKQDTLCAILFNVQGYLYEELKGDNNVQ